MSNLRLLCAIFALGVPVFGWDNLGHMTVAYVAYQQLTPAARAEMTRLIKLNPKYSEWIAGIPEEDRDLRAFLLAATWPDLIKRDSTYTADGPDHGDRPPNDPSAAQNIG